MMTAKVISNGGSQAVRLPKSCRFDGPEVNVNRVGDAVVLTPKGDGVFSSMLSALDLFTDDFMAGVEDLPLLERVAL